jgi:MFS family permease
MQNTSTSETSVIWVTTLTSFLVPFLISSVNVALPVIQSEFFADAVILSWVATAYILATAIFLVPIGKVADIYGRKKTFLLGLALFVLTTLFTAWVPSINMLIMLRVLQGASSAMLMTTGMAILTSVVAPQHRGRAIGIYVSAVYIGLAAGPFGGGLITQYLGWRWIFLSGSLLGFVCIWITLKSLKGEWRGSAGRRLDWIGTLLYGSALFFLVYGAGLLPGKKGLLLAAAGSVLLVIFFLFEGRISQPVFEVSLFFNNRLFAFSGLAALISYASTFAVTFLMSLYLQYVKGITPQFTGMILISQPVVQALFSPVSGRLSDKIEPLHLASLGMAVTTTGLLLLSFINTATPLYYIVVILLLLGFGFALFSSPNMNAIMGSVDRAHFGLASGTVATMRLLGQMTSMAIATLMFAIFIGREQIGLENLDRFLVSFKYTLLLFSVLCSAGIFFSLMRGELREKKK